MLHGAGTLSTRALAGAIAYSTEGTDPAPPPVDRPGAGIGVFVRGQDRTGMLVMDSLSVTEEIGARGAASFRLIDKTGNFHPAIGAPVHIYFNGNLIFGGTIDDLSEETILEHPHLFIDVECVDYNQLADRHIVAAAYEDQTLRQIVTDIIDVQSGDPGERLSDEGVTYTDDSITDDNTLISAARFSYEYASECFDALSELTGYSWWIDHKKVFHMHEPDHFAAPQPLNDETWQGYADLRFSADRQDYRNVQYLIGGQAKTEEVTDDLVWTRYFKGDGENKVFNVDLPLADKPRLFIDSGGGYAEVDADDIDLREVDDETKTWYYSIGDTAISHNRDSGTSALTSSQTLQVRFQGYVPILQQGRIESAVIDRGVIEGGSGVYVNVQEETNVDDRALARERVEGLLRRFSTIPQRVRFSTMLHGFHAGQRLPADIPRHGVSGFYVIHKLSFDLIADDPDRPFRYMVDATHQTIRGTWTDWYKRLIQKGRPWAYSEDQALQLLRRLEDLVTVSDALSYTLSNTLADWNDDEGTWCLIDTMVIGDVRDMSETSTDTAVVGPRIGLPMDIES